MMASETGIHPVPRYEVAMPDSQHFNFKPRIMREKTMRNTLVKLITVLVITAIGAFGADESLGTWNC
jgi:hypothetical protein